MYYIITKDALYRNLYRQSCIRILYYIIEQTEPMFIIKPSSYINTGSSRIGQIPKGKGVEKENSLERRAKGMHVVNRGLCRCTAPFPKPWSSLQCESSLFSEAVRDGQLWKRGLLWLPMSLWLSIWCKLTKQPDIPSCASARPSLYRKKWPKADMQISLKMIQLPYCFFGKPIIKYRDKKDG